MTLASTARFNASLTAQAYRLVPAVRTEMLDTGYVAVVGECGHRLTVVRTFEQAGWDTRIAEGRRHRRRCERCVKGPEAHKERLTLGR